MDATIRSYYNHLTKDEISLILAYYDVRYPRTAKKPELLDIIAEFMGGHPADWMMRLTERDLYLLKDLTDAGPGGWISYDMPEFPSLLERICVVDVDETVPDDLQISLKEGFYLPVAALIDQIIHDKQEDGTFLADRIVLGVLNLYGVLSTGEFVRIVHDVIKGEPDKDMLLEDIVGSEYVGFTKMAFGGEVYLVSPYVIDAAKLLEARKDFKRFRKPVSFDIDTVELAGAGAPFCAFGYGNEKYVAVKEALQDLGYDELDIEDIINEIWQASQYSSQSEFAEILFDSVNSRIEDFDDFHAYQSAINAIADYANSVPKWILKGRDSDSTDCLKISIRVEESPLAADESYAPGIPEQTNTNLSSPLSEFYKYNMAVKHVAPDAPCPCGSGLSYRRCHGKNLS